MRPLTPLLLLCATLAAAQTPDVDDAATSSAMADSAAHATSDTGAVPAGVFPNTWRIDVVDGSSFANLGLLGISTDTLVLMGTAPTIRIDDIQTMRRRNGGHFWRGVAWGAGIMSPLAITGISMVGSSTGSYEHALGQSLTIVGIWIGGAFLGGAIGSLFPRTEEVQLAILPAEERVPTLRRLIIADSNARSQALDDLRDRERRRAVRAAWQKKKN